MQVEVADAVCPPPPAKIRRIVNLQGQEVTTGGLAKPVRDVPLNTQMRYLVLHLHEAYFKYMGVAQAKIKHIDVTMKVTGLIWTSYTLVKQAANRSGNVIQKVKDTSVLNIGGIDRTVGELKDIFIKICNLYGLVFDGSPQSKDMRGTFQMNLCLLYAFRYRCNEGVYLNNTYKIGEGAGIETVVPIDSWGVMKRHYPFMYGGNFPPSMQSALIQQLGPAALMIGLAETVSPNYQDKWVNAVKGQLSGVPNIGAITDLIKGTREAHASLITSVLDIAALGTARQVHKASFTWCMLRAVTAGSEYQSWAAEIQEQVEAGGVKRYNLGQKLTDKEILPIVAETDYSGKRMWYLYNAVAKHTFVLSCIDGVNEDVYRQWLSYSTIGLWTEDTAVLETVFGRQPILRCDYGDAFKGRRTQGMDRNIKLYPALWVSKLASAAQTKLGAVDPYVAARGSCVSGRASSDWNDDDVRNIYLQPVGGSSRNAVTGAMRLKDALDDHKKRIERLVTRDKRIDYGTTSWYKVDETSDQDNYGTEDKAKIVKLNNSYIFSARNVV